MGCHILIWNGPEEGGGPTAILMRSMRFSVSLVDMSYRQRSFFDAVESEVLQCHRWIWCPGIWGIHFSQPRLRKRDPDVAGVTALRCSLSTVVPVENHPVVMNPI